MKVEELKKEEAFYSGTLSVLLLSPSDLGERKFESLCEKLYILKQNDLWPYDARKVAGGYNSKDLDRYISGLMLAGGFLVKKHLDKDRYVLTKKGIKWCQRQYKEAKELCYEKIEKVLEVLKLQENELFDSNFISS